MSILLLLLLLLQQFGNPSFVLVHNLLVVATARIHAAASKQGI
jgi:hypothetical protein